MGDVNRSPDFDLPTGKRGGAKNQAEVWDVAYRYFRRALDLLL